MSLSIKTGCGYFSRSSQATNAMPNILPPAIVNKTTSTAMPAPPAPLPMAARAPDQQQDSPPIVSGTGIVGQTPSSDPPFDLQVAENFTSPVAENILSLIVPRDLKHRLLYLWTFSPLAANGYALFDVTFWNNNGRISTIRHELGFVGNTTNNKSFLSVWANGGNAANDSVLLVVGSPVGGDAQPTSVTLQPIRFNAEIDRITLSLKELVGAAYARSFMACLSSLQTIRQG